MSATDYCGNDQNALIHPSIFTTYQRKQVLLLNRQTPMMSVLFHLFLNCNSFM